MKKQSERQLVELLRILKDELQAKTQTNLSPYQTQAVKRFADRCAKKAQVESNTNRLHDEALQSFKSLNEEVSHAKVTCDPVVLAEARDFIFRALCGYSKTLDPEGVQDTFRISHVLDRWRFGPGASNGVSGTHTADKVSRRFTATDSAHSLTRSLVLTHPYLGPLHSVAFGNDDLVEVLAGSRLTTVLKNEVERRVIAIECSGNMALQLGWSSVLEGTLRFIGNDLKNQQAKNKYQAYVGSLTGDRATVDLKKASDRQLIELMRLLWPRDCFNFMMATRSTQTELRFSDGHVEDVPLNMLSTMGNGWTFPVMTLTLTSLLYANARVNHAQRQRRVDWSRYAVFGDDIILPTAQYDSFCEVLQSCGYVVNYDKSYSTGPFRESCGGDYYDGVDVTPVYVKSIADDDEIYVALNQLMSWQGKTRVFLPVTVSYLISLLRKDVLLVPEWMPDYSGIRTEQVPRRFRYLRYEFSSKAYNGPYEMCLIAGGYLTSVREGPPTYVTRESSRKVRRCWGLVPKGYQSGWDPFSRSQGDSAYIGSLLTAVMP
jgi:hypothetical protein